MDNTPLLMMLPQLLGAQHQIQYMNHQPNMPTQTMPSQMPKMGTAARMPGLPNMPSAPQQAQQDPTSMFGGPGAMQGAMNNLNLPYWSNKIFGGGFGGGGISPMSAPSSFDLSAMLPNLGIFGG